MEKLIEVSKLLKKNPAARANLATAVLSDEISRLASQERSKNYLLSKEKDDQIYPYWETALLYFLLGVLFAFAMDGLAWNWIDIVRHFNPGI